MRHSYLSLANSKNSWAPALCQAVFKILCVLAHLNWVNLKLLRANGVGVQGKYSPVLPVYSAPHIHLIGVPLTLSPLASNLQYCLAHLHSPPMTLLFASYFTEKLEAVRKAIKSSKSPKTACLYSHIYYNLPFLLLRTVFLAKATSIRNLFP